MGGGLPYLDRTREITVVEIALDCDFARNPDSSERLIWGDPSVTPRYLVVRPIPDDLFEHAVQSVPEDVRAVSWNKKKTERTPWMIRELRRGALRVGPCDPDLRFIPIPTAFESTYRMGYFFETLACDLEIEISELLGCAAMWTMTAR